MTDGHESAIPDDVMHLAQDLGSPSVAIEPLRTLNSPRRIPAAFRVRLADGRQVKARLLSHESHAIRVEFVLRRFPRRVFPEVLLRRGRALALEWIHGAPAADSAGSAELVRACGSIHAFIHTTVVPAGCGYEPADPVGMARAKLRADLGTVVARGALQDSEADRIAKLADRFAPTRADVGFVHRDFCSCNIVIRESGEIGVVDNETVSVGPLEFDLARTWYRWPMEPSERMHYFTAYERQRRIANFVAHFPFWALAVLVDSIGLRLDAGDAVRHVPIDRLRGLLAALKSGVTSERLVFES